VITVSISIIEGRSKLASASGRYALRPGRTPAGYVVIGEVHARRLYTDVLLLVLRHALLRRPGARALPDPQHRSPTLGVTRKGLGGSGPAQGPAGRPISFQSDPTLLSHSSSRDLPWGGPVGTAIWFPPSRGAYSLRAHRDRGPCAGRRRRASSSSPLPTTPPTSRPTSPPGAAPLQMVPPQGARRVLSIPRRPFE